MIRVVVIDDSAFSRVSIGKMLESDPRIKVVGYAVDGETGLRKYHELRPDVVTLDLEMPRMGGFSALRMLMQNGPVPIIVVSSRSERQDVFKALDLGAVDFVAKPERATSSELYSISSDLINKVVEAAAVHVWPRKPDLAEDAGPAASAELPRYAADHRSTALLIGASTGGPPALHHLLSSLKEKLPVPVAIAQHMPPGFTRSFAERLNEHSVMEVKEAEDGDDMIPGRILVCPGSKNMELQHFGGVVRARIVDPPETQIYTPSVNVLFRTAAYVYGSKALAVVLTGMGNDGAAGVEEVVNQGGRALAESEESCVVFGMPKEALLTGKVEKAVPLTEMCAEIEHRCRPRVFRI